MASAPVPPASPVPPKPGVPVAVIVLIVGVVLVAIIGMLAAIAIPSFIKYTRRAKAAEADANLAVLVADIQAKYGELGALPPGLPPTPPPSCARQPWPAATAAPGWTQLGFAPAGLLYYSYSIDATPDGGIVFVRAVGDLNCNGVFGRFERSVAVARDGSLVVGPLIRTDELE
jgi:type II secretory pathway pseudopilin PulG